MATNNLGGTYTFPGTDLTVHRMGYGAMQIAGPHVFGPPKDEAECIAVLREAVESGVNHIDTSDFYGPHVTNQIIKKALHPYKDGLVIVSKVGAKRDAKGGWPHARSPQEITDAIHDNLRNLGLDAIDVVNMRMGGMDRPEEGSIAPQIEALAKLREQGLVKHIGVSTVSATQIKEAQSIVPIVCVQNLYNLARREDETLIDALNEQGIPYVPYFPLGGFTPLQSDELNEVAASLNATPMQVALAWLLHRSPNILLIPGTSSRRHLRENLAAADLKLPAEALTKLNAISKSN